MLSRLRSFDPRYCTRRKGLFAGHEVNASLTRSPIGPRSVQAEAAFRAYRGRRATTMRASSLTSGALVGPYSERGQGSTPHLLRGPTAAGAFHSVDVNNFG